MAIHNQGTADFLVQLKLTLPLTLPSEKSLRSTRRKGPLRPGTGLSARPSATPTHLWTGRQDPVSPSRRWPGSHVQSRPGAGKGSIRAPGAAASRDWERAGAKMFLILAPSCLARLHHSLLITCFLLPSTPPSSRARSSRGLQTPVWPPQWPLRQTAGLEPEPWGLGQGPRDQVSSRGEASPGPPTRATQPTREGMRVTRTPPRGRNLASGAFWRPEGPCARQQPMCQSSPSSSRCSRLGWSVTKEQCCES